MRTTLSRPDFVMLEHLHATWHRARRERLDPHLEIQAEEKRFSLVRKYDPTSEGLYHGWLAAWRRRLWDERGYRHTLGGEELLEARRALTRFHALRPKLSGDLRDIGLYKTVADLRSVIPTSIRVSQRNAEAAAAKVEAYAGSEVLFREGAWRVLQLHSYAASCFWGLGTKWCTTTSENVFRHYIARGRLFVVLTPRGRFQLNSGGQFMDASDHEVDLRAFQDAPEAMQELLRRVR